MKNKVKLFAFTMAEAILVMTVLGIIATIMITTMKPVQFKEKGYQVLAKDLFGSIESALNSVLDKYSPYSQLDKLYSPDKTVLSENISSSNHVYYLSTELQEYLSTSRENKKCSGSEGESDDFNYCYNESNGMKDSFFLKKGSWLKIAYKNGDVETVEPITGELITISGGNLYIFLDVNGKEEPNTLGKDRYVYPASADAVSGFPSAAPNCVSGSNQYACTVCSAEDEILDDNQVVQGGKLHTCCIKDASNNWYIVKNGRAYACSPL